MKDAHWFTKRGEVQKAKHTLGPWIAPKDQVNMVFRQSDYGCQQIGALKEGLQITVSLNRGEEQAAADARLIAAAPELLDALTNFTLNFSDLVMAFPEISDEVRTYLQGAFECASRVIAKAEGES
jgi:hypothetical protein